MGCIGGPRPPGEVVEATPIEGLVLDGGLTMEGGAKPGLVMGRPPAVTGLHPGLSGKMAW